MSLVAVPLALILTYVWLTAQLTAQTYRLHDDQSTQTVLLQHNNELRQQVARLESLPRLEAAAAKLKMSVPPGIALVAPAQPPAKTAAQTAFAASLAESASASAACLCGIVTFAPMKPAPPSPRVVSANTSGGTGSS